MRNILTLLYLSFLMLVVSSCGCYRHLPEASERHDSISIIYKDSTVYHIDTLWVQLPDARSSAVRPSCDSSHLEIDVAYSDAYVDSLGMLHHNLVGLPRKLPLLVPIPEHTLTVDRAHASSEMVTVTKYVDRPLTWWQKFWIRAGRALLVLFVVLIIARRFLR